MWLHRIATDAYFFHVFLQVHPLLLGLHCFCQPRWFHGRSAAATSAKWYFWGYSFLMILMGYTVKCGFPEMGVPQIIHFDRIFHHKPTILGSPIYGNPQMAIYDAGTPFLDKPHSKLPSTSLRISHSSACLASPFVSTVLGLWRSLEGWFGPRFPISKAKAMALGVPILRHTDSHDGYV